MNWKYAIPLIVFISLASFAGAAQISGTIFEWYTLEPMQNAIVEINSVPQQTFVATDGIYSFSVPDGNYTLIAKYFEDNRLKYEDTENVLVNADGNFTIDLIMFPTLDTQELLYDDFNYLNAQDLENEKSKNSDYGQIIAGLALVGAAILLVFFFAKKTVKKTTGLEVKRMGIEEKSEMIASAFAEPEEKKPVTKENTETKNATQQPGQEKIQPDLSELLEKLKNYGGRMTQKELREKTGIGEAKLSLMVAELESLGKVKKIKQGRGNIIVLK